MDASTRRRTDIEVCSVTHSSYFRAESLCAARVNCASDVQPCIVTGSGNARRAGTTKSSLQECRIQIRLPPRILCADILKLRADLANPLIRLGFPDHVVSPLFNHPARTAPPPPAAPPQGAAPRSARPPSAPSRKSSNPPSLERGARPALASPPSRRASNKWPCPPRARPSRSTCRSSAIVRRVDAERRARDGPRPGALSIKASVSSRRGDAELRLFSSS